MKKLSRVNGHFYFVMRVPVDMQKVFNRKVIKKSLHTTQLSNAKLILKKYDYELERLFTLVRCGVLNKNLIEALVQEFFYKTLREYAYMRTERVGIPTRDVLEDPENEEFDSYGGHYEGCKVAIDEGTEAYLTKNYEYIAPITDEFLTEHGLKVNKDSHEYKLLCEKMLEAYVEIHKVEKDRILGIESTTTTLTMKTKDLQAPVIVDNKQTGVLLSKAIKAFIDVKVSKKEFNQATVDDSMSVFNLLLQVVGDVDIKTIDKDAAIKFMSTVNKIPKNMNVIKEFKGKPIDEVLKIVERKNKKKEGSVKLLSDSSRKKYVERASMLFKWCVDADYCDKNYFKNLAVKVDEENKQKRRPYTREELLKLIHSPIFTDKSLSFENAYQFFIPLIGLFAGMRMNEICQLYCEDIREIQGIWCIDVNKNTPDKRLKSKAARRIVPIHPVLIEAGLVKFKKLMEEQGNDRMWMSLKLKKGNYKQDYSEEFNKYIDKYVSDDKQVNFHVFRNTLSDNLKQQGISISEAPVAAILGHKHPNITFDTYGQSYNPKPLLEVLMKLDYAELFKDIRFSFRE